MFVFKKSKTAVYHSESTGADFKFRQSTDVEKEELKSFIVSEAVHGNRDNLYANWQRNREDYYAAWLMEGFSGVEDENGKAHNIADIDLLNKAGLIKTLRQTDSEFSAWFASHCEGAEKKDGKNDSAGEVVGSEGVQGL